MRNLNRQARSAAPAVRLMALLLALLLVLAACVDQPTPTESAPVEEPAATEPVEEPAPEEDSRHGVLGHDQRRHGPEAGHCRGSNESPGVPARRNRTGARGTSVRAELDYLGRGLRHQPHCGHWGTFTKKSSSPL